MLQRCWLVLLLLSAAAFADAQPPAVAAASDLQFALEEVAAQFSRETGEMVDLSFGSSGNFYRQIQQGGPFQIFLSADEDYALKLAEQGLAEDAGSLYAIGRLALYAPNGAGFSPDEQMADLRRALLEGRIRHFAVANPEHAPYGRAAKQVLLSQGLWETLQPVLVLGENIAQTAQFAVTGAADGAIIAYALALSPRLKAQGSFALLPETRHEPLRQRMVLLKNAAPGARRFYAYLQQAPARAILQRYGFVVPD